MYEIILKQLAVEDLDRLRKRDAAMIADAMEEHLSHEPCKESRSRIKRLRGVTDPDYRLRVGEYRVFYNVDTPARTVVILRVMSKAETASYYEDLES